MCPSIILILTMMSHSSNGALLNIVLNGSEKVRAYSLSSGTYRTGTNMALLQLYKGDSVWVSRHGGKGYHTHDVPLTTFSGFLLK